MYHPFKYWANFNGGYMTHDTDKDLDCIDTCIASACAVILFMAGIIGLLN